MELLTELFPEGRVYLVGGAVRDELMGRQPKDRDYVICGILPNVIEGRLSEHGEVSLVGKSFGVFKFKYRNEIIDVAIPRTEKSVGNGHKDFEVIASHKLPIELDLVRRDFTINSIARNMTTGELIDPSGGVRDIESRKLKLVGVDAFEEDPLRMLRAIQFKARFDMTFDLQLFRSMKKNAHLISTISPERISSEICKLLTADKPSIGFEVMNQTGILELVLPELKALDGVTQTQHHAFDAYWHTLNVIDEIKAPKKDLVWLRWAAIFHDLGKKETRKWNEVKNKFQFIGHHEVSEKLAIDILRRLRVNSTDGFYIPEDRILNIVRNHMFTSSMRDNPDDEVTDKALRRIVAKVGWEDIVNLFRFKFADFKGKGKDATIKLENLYSLLRRTRLLRHQKLAAFGIKDLDIDGKDIMAHLNIQSGPKVGEILKGLFEIVLDDPEKNDGEILLNLARGLV